MGCFKKAAGAPKFKKKGQQDSFTLEGAVKVLGNNNSGAKDRCAQDLNGYLKSSQNPLPSAAKLIDGTLASDLMWNSSSQVTQAS